MLISINENKVLVDKAPTIQDLRLNVDLLKKGARVKFGIVTETGVENVDLSLGWHLPSLKVRGLMGLSMFSFVLKFEAGELIRNNLFSGELSISLSNKTVSTSMNVKRLDSLGKEIKDPKCTISTKGFSESLSCLKTILLETNKSN